jgi:hypothetical protein
VTRVLQALSDLQSNRPSSSSSITTTTITTTTTTTTTTIIIIIIIITTNLLHVMCSRPSRLLKSDLSIFSLSGLEFSFR